MKHIFISYARKDIYLVDQVVNKIGSAGYKYWIDRKDIQGGDLWREELVEAIENSYVFIIMLSQNSVSSNYVLQELNQAIEQNKFILPLKILEVSIPEEVKYLEERQYIDLVQDWEDGLEKLLIRLKQLRDPNVNIPDPEKIFWPFLLSCIESNNCIPILGPGMYSDTLPNLYTKIAQEMAKHLKYWDIDTNNLGQVAKSLELIETRLYARKEFVAQLEKCLGPDFSMLNESHKVLAKLPFNIFINTNYDNSMLHALTTCDKNGQYVYNSEGRFYNSNGEVEEVESEIKNDEYYLGNFFLRNDVLIVHPFGHIRNIDQIYLTDNDFRRIENDLEIDWQAFSRFPRYFKADIATNSLLFLGFRPDDINFRTILGIKNRLEKIDRFSFVQYMPIDATHQSINEMKNYDIEIFIGSVSEFVKELQEKWDNYIKEHSYDS
jgi:hypothetical protein